MAGPLTEAVLPDPVLGFRGVPAVPTEAEFNPNGTWVHAVDGAVAGFEAWPRCSEIPANLPEATHALAGAYADAAGRTGNALALQFESARAAGTYYRAYIADLGRCPRAGAAYLVVPDLTETGESFAARRNYPATGATWSELGRLSQDRLVLVILGSDELPMDDLARTSAEM